MFEQRAGGLVMEPSGKLQPGMDGREWNIVGAHHAIGEIEHPNDTG